MRLRLNAPAEAQPQNLKYNPSVRRSPTALGSGIAARTYFLAAGTAAFGLLCAPGVAAVGPGALAGLELSDFK